MPDLQNKVSPSRRARCRCAVIWIDWYAYHVSRFRGLQEAFGTDGEVVGIELVGGIGVHAGLRFREELPADLAVETLMPQSNWHEADKGALATALWRKLSALNPEVVLVPGYYTLPAIAAAVWARVHGRASVLMTESTSEDHARSAWKERLKGLLIRILFTHAVSGGKAHVRYLRQLGFPADRVARFYDVVGNEQIENETAGLRRTQDTGSTSLPEKYFLYVGRLAPEKNVQGLLTAWLQYRSEGGTWALVLVGGGAEADSLRQRAEASPYLQDVILPGHQGFHESMPFFSFASCFVLPSVREPWGLVVNEAMAASLPVIVSRRCGCAEDLVEEGGNGLLFDPRDGHELTRCLHAMESAPGGERMRMGERSRELIAGYSPRSFGLEVEGIAETRNHAARQRAQANTERAA